MSSSRALATSRETLWQSPETADERSGVRRIAAIVGDAARSWEEENRRDEAAEVAMFEWDLFLAELDPARTPRAYANATAAGAARGVGAEALFGPSLAEEQAWTERRPRRAKVQAAGRLLIGGAFVGMLAITAMPAGSDAIASWLTMGHHDQARAQVAEMTHRLTSARGGR